MERCEQRSIYYVSSTSNPGSLTSSPDRRDIPLVQELRACLTERNIQLPGQNYEQPPPPSRLSELPPPPSRLSELPPPPASLLASPGDPLQGRAQSPQPAEVILIEDSPPVMEQPLPPPPPPQQEIMAGRQLNPPREARVPVARSPLPVNDYLPPPPPPHDQVLPPVQSRHTLPAHNLHPEAQLPTLHSLTHGPGQQLQRQSQHPMMASAGRQPAFQYCPQPQGSAQAAHHYGSLPASAGYPEAYPRAHPQASHPYLPGPHPGLTQQQIGSRVLWPRIEAPSFPNFVHDDPLEFAMLKMALLNLLPPGETEQYKYHILLDHLKLDTARHLALAYAHSSLPYTCALAALQKRYGQPHQLVLREISNILSLPSVRSGDARHFSDFAMRVRALVGMLQSLETSQSDAELACASHVQQLLGKLPSDLVASYARQARITRPGASYNLVDFSDWLEQEAECQMVATQVGQRGRRETFQRDRRPLKSEYPISATILHGTSQSQKKSQISGNGVRASSSSSQRNSCPFCTMGDHHLSVCPDFRQLPSNEVRRWIVDKGRCWRCGREHRASQCDLKRLCPKCGGKHLGVLHEANQTKADPGTSYLIRSSCSTKVLLKVVRVVLSYRGKNMDTYAILDDGSERTMLLNTAADSLGLDGAAESLLLRTVRQDTETFIGKTVSFNIAPASDPQKKFIIKGAFTSGNLRLSEQTYPPRVLQRFKHLQGLPLQAFEKVQPTLLIGSDHPHLLCPVDRVILGPGCGPAAVHTRLGWALQGPTMFPEEQSRPPSLQPVDIFFIGNGSCEMQMQLREDVQRLWQIDVLPYQSTVAITRSKRDQEAVANLDNHTVRVTVDGVNRYATPLLRVKNAPPLKVPPGAVMSMLRNAEKRLVGTPERAEIYNAEIAKLIDAGYVKKLSPSEVSQSSESWYIPHHLVEHNGKHRLVFNCSFKHSGQSLNDLLLPGPVLGPTLIGVLLRFRQHLVAISGDIKAMFHQVRLLDSDKPLLRFLWRNMNREQPPDIFEWQVLPFGTTCSPCCATYAVQRHVKDSQPGHEDVLYSVLNSFYVDNCLQSFPTEAEARDVLDHLRAVLDLGGFNIRQWASNRPSVIQHLPPEARSDSTEQWLSYDRTEPLEGTLGLSWHFASDTLGYKHRPVTYQQLTLRNVYRVLASQYDPLGFIIPYTTRAKILLQQLWWKEREWDDPALPAGFKTTWMAWEDELPDLSAIKIPRCYSPDTSECITQRELHIFCDASEKAYGAVAYMRMQNDKDQIHISFVMARSRVSPKRQLSIPRLELCAALSGVQLAKLLQTELSLPIHRTVLWSDSTTVLTWLCSENCQYKVFVANRVTEILDNSDPEDWRYVNSACNPADDITRGMSLRAIADPSRWSQGPAFLHLPPEQWPQFPVNASPEACSELRKPTFCGNVQAPAADLTPVDTPHQSWEALVDSTLSSLSKEFPVNPPGRSEAELLILRKAQSESFPEEYRLLKAGKPIAASSRLITLAPEFDPVSQVIRVGGRLRQSEDLTGAEAHPMVLDPKHPITTLLIGDFDRRLLHPGPERVFASLRNQYWILRGRQAVRKYQHTCVECKRWKGKPIIPKMSDLPPCRLRLRKPPFWSTGMDCFGPFTVKIARRSEKRWGILFKCLTTRCVHLDVLTKLDADSFLLSFRRFVARRGCPYEVISDQGTNFIGGARELEEAFANLVPALQEQLAKQKVKFRLNPPHAPHFGGSWEREVRAVKTALRVTLGKQTVAEEVLRTVLVEVEEILNSKPLGYVSSDLADADPVTPNFLLMGRREAALPQVMYSHAELLSNRRWRHSQILADQFWSCFIKNYLPALQTRQKWRQDTPNLTPSTVVMVIDRQLPRALWPVGKIKTLKPSKDGRIRTAEVLINGKTYVRPVSTLIPLPCITDDDDDDDVNT